jgi:putative hydrolase of the HAD superfamily
VFDALYGIEDAEYAPKPHAQAYATVFAIDGVDGRSAAMFEDDPRNLAVPHGLGMRTVLVGPGDIEPHIHYRTNDLAEFLGRLV